MGVYRLSRWGYDQTILARVSWAVLSVYPAGVAYTCLVLFADAPSLDALGTGVGLVTAGFLSAFLLPPLWLVFVTAIANHE